MELYNASDAPSIDKGVLVRLKRLDPLLHVTFSHYSIDPARSVPLEVTPSPDWEDDSEAMRRLTKHGGANYLLDPAHHLWTATPNGRYLLVQSYPAPVGFGHREVARLEADVARYMRPSDIAALIHRKQADHAEREKSRYSGYREDLASANKSRIGALMDGDLGIRDARIASYPGQSNRSAPGQVRKDAGEDGWERLSEDEYRNY